MDWEQQAKQFKLELDRVNPLLDVATHTVSEQGLTIVALKAEIERLTLTNNRQSAAIASVLAAVRAVTEG